MNHNVPAAFEQIGGDVDLYLVRIADRVLVADGGAVFRAGSVQGLHYRTMPPVPSVLASASDETGLAGEDIGASRNCWIPLSMVGGGGADNDIGTRFIAVEIDGQLFAIWPYNNTFIPV